MDIGLDTDEVDAERRERILTNISLTPLTEAPENGAFNSFDVRSDGAFILGCTFPTNCVAAFDKNGDFLYGYKFDTAGSFDVAFDGDGFAIYLVRSDVVASFDKKGNALELRMVKDTEKNNYYINNVFHAFKKEAGGCTYEKTNNMGVFNLLAFSFSRLVRTAADGNRTVIYDTSTFQNVRTAVIACAVIAFIAISAASFARLVKSNARRNA